MKSFIWLMDISDGRRDIDVWRNSVDGSFTFVVDTVDETASIRLSKESVQQLIAFLQGTENA